MSSVNSTIILTLCLLGCTPIATLRRSCADVHFVEQDPACVKYHAAQEQHATARKLKLQRIAEARRAQPWRNKP